MFADRRPMMGQYSTGGRSTPNRLPSPKDSRLIKEKTGQLSFFAAGCIDKAGKIPHKISRLSADCRSTVGRLAPLTVSGLSKQLFKFHGFYSEYV